MAEAAAKSNDDAKELAKIRALCDERVTIEHRLYNRHKTDYSRMDAIDAELKEKAREREEAIRETITGKGTISVSPPTEEVCTGKGPVLVVEKYYALPEKERARAPWQEAVVIEEQWKKAYAGRVMVKLF